MNWTIYLTTIGLILAVAGFLHQLLIKRKEATIETLTEKNRWLEGQLELAQKNSPDVLTERLSKRLSLLEAELLRLSQDHEKNETIIKTKEAELLRVKEIMAEVAAEQAKRAADDRKEYEAAMIADYPRRRARAEKEELLRTRPP